MSNRVTGKALRAVALVGLAAGTAAALSGCTALGSRAFADPTTTGSVSTTSPVSAPGNTLQPMPKALSSPMRVAEGPYTPPSNIGGGSNMAPAVSPIGTGAVSPVSSQNLPMLTSSTSQGNPTPMSAQPSISPVPAAPAATAMVAPPAAKPTASPSLASVPADAYVHVIESGESLYTIARRYDVTAQSIVQANGFDSPDRIYVGQKIVIPGRPDLLARKAAPEADSSDDATAAPVQVASVEPEASTPVAEPAAVETATPVAASKPLVQPQVEPTLSGADKFRWPVSGRVITDFANSNGTGINIESPEGAAIRATENGQVIYVGNGVEGYGNLVLIRHPNGYVSAYAHLKAASVAKGQVVNRGDSIGAAGMTGGVSRPQLHFELRKGATPVDPVPLLAG